MKNLQDKEKSDKVSNKIKQFYGSMNKGKKTTKRMQMRKRSKKGQRENG